MTEVFSRVKGLAHDGSGVVPYDSKTYFVYGVLPDEAIIFRPGKKYKGRYEGKLLEVVEPSEYRVEPPCVYFGLCGGCVLQHYDATAQINNKQNTLIENLARIAKVTPREIIQPLQGEQWGYRRKARLGVKHVPKKGGVLIGFRERNSRFITSLSKCKVLDKRISELLPGLHLMIEDLSCNNKIPQIEVAVADNSTALIFRHLEALTDRDQGILIDFAKRWSVQIFSQAKGLDSIRPLYPETPKPLFYALNQGDLKLAFTPCDFIQVNAKTNQAMINQALFFLSPRKTDAILDLFCGIGNFSLPIAATGASVLGIEGDNVLVQRAQQNAKNNELDNVRFIVSNLHQHGLAPLLRKIKPNKVLLDPPRSGSLEVVQVLCEMQEVEKVIYVSCNPATLARDAEVLVNAGGFALLAAGVIDMFPHTAHVEAMAVFARPR